MFINVKGFLKDILSSLCPALCPLCHAVMLEAHEYFCPACMQAFEHITPPYCSRCGDPLSGKREKTALLCLNCLFLDDTRAPPLSIRSAALYYGGLRQAILMLKYHGHLYMAPPLARFVKDQYPLFFSNNQFDLILPVPLHLTRLRQREFNQCVLLAQPLAEYIDLPLELDSVARTRHTFSQSVSKSAERKANLKGAFQVIKPAAIAGKCILIFDDVYTTGATLEALSQCLYAAGAKKVSAFTLARARNPVAPKPQQKAELL